MTPIWTIVLFASLMCCSQLANARHLPSNEDEAADLRSYGSQDSLPYSSMVFDRSLPFVPRYRYPIKPYLKRNRLSGAMLPNRDRRDYWIRVQNNDNGYDYDHSLMF